MTQQDDITQRVLTDAEIEALAKKHIAPHADRLDAIMANPVPYQKTEQFRRVKALIVDVLSKLRAPVSSIREGFELTYAADADDPACAADLSHFTNGWRACLMSQARAPVADERAALDLLDTLFTAYENGTPCYEEPDSQGGYLGMAFRIDDDTFRACADLLNKERPRTAGALASAPVAGEAPIRLSPDVLDYLKEGVENATGCEESDVDYDFANELLRLINGPLYAAPQASAAITHYECGPYNGADAYEAVPVCAAPLASVGDARRALGGRQTDSFRTLKTHPTPAVAKNGAEVRRPFMTLAEFCAEAGRIGLAADTLAAQLATRPEFADCLPQAGEDGGDSAKGTGDRPEQGAKLTDEACWKFVEAMPHQLPGPILNDLKPALYAAICHVLADRQQRSALAPSTQPTENGGNDG